MCYNCLRLLRACDKEYIFVVNLCEQNLNKAVVGSKQWGINKGYLLKFISIY